MPPGPEFLRAATGVCACVILAICPGCTTLSSLGLPLAGPHRLLLATETTRRAAGHPTGLPRELNKEVVDIYIVEPGDVLVVEPADFNSSARFGGGDQLVKPDGSIDLGKYGQVTAAGRTLVDIQADVQAIVESQDETAGQILVRLVAWESKVFYVLGEVNSPGAYPYSGRETVLDAIVSAGDLTDRANRHKIVFSRPSEPDDCRIALPVCYNEIVQLGDTTSNYQLRAGDRVFVTSMTLWDDIVQTLCPGQFEKCPRCSGRHLPCYVGTCDDENCPDCSQPSQFAEPLPLEPE